MDSVIMGLSRPHRVIVGHLQQTLIRDGESQLLIQRLHEPPLLSQQGWLIQWTLAVLANTGFSSVERLHRTSGKSGPQRMRLSPFSFA